MRITKTKGGWNIELGGTMHQPAGLYEQMLAATQEGPAATAEIRKRIAALSWAKRKKPTGRGSKKQS